jgi:nucleoside-diphosphate-sugar epimerase
MKVLVTGSEGYIGAVLRDWLLAHGHEVVGLDTGYFDECDFHVAPTRIPVIKKDLRNVALVDVQGFDCVIHLAALSNDPLGELHPSITEAINTQASIRLAELAKQSGVSRFLFASSCSMYGQGAEQGLTEESPFRPQTAYARSKVDVEYALAGLADDQFSPTYLRNATAFGLSPRMRFDLVVNNLVGWAWTAGRIVLTSDGSPWRPLVHTQDIAKAFVCTLEAPRDAVHNAAFNVGASDHNFQIATIAAIVANHFPGCAVEVGLSTGDTRTYNVDFSKIHTKLPGFDGIDYPIDRAVDEMKQVCDQIALNDEQFHGRLYTRLKQIRHLQEAGLLDDHLLWRVH